MGKWPKIEYLKSDVCALHFKGSSKKLKQAFFCILTSKQVHWLKSPFSAFFHFFVKCEEKGTETEKCEKYTFLCCLLGFIFLSVGRHLKAGQLLGVTFRYLFHRAKVMEIISPTRKEGFIVNTSACWSSGIQKTCKP